MIYAIGIGAAAIGFAFGKLTGKKRNNKAVRRIDSNKRIANRKDTFRKWISYGEVFREVGKCRTL